MADHRDSIEGEDAVFIERVAAQLRSPEQLDPSFEHRLMERVRAESAGARTPSSLKPESGWNRPRLVRLAPLATLAVAAGVSAIFVLSGVAIGSRMSSPARVTASTAIGVPLKTDTVQLVRFVFVDSRAKRIELVGDFNEWTKGATKLALSGAPGVWAVSVPLTPGRHEYAFIVNGSKWTADPLAIKSSDDFGTESSVIDVGLSPKSTT
ncbi:MAG: hypothetical protein NVSMB53_18650 [Gemmatimonadaceae bacterium]